MSAIRLTKDDFGVTYGVRSIEEQKILYESGRSQTMNSKHLTQESTGYSHAVDLVAYIGPKISWELNVYDDVAEAMKTGAQSEDVAESLTKQLLETGSLTFGGLNSEDMVTDRVSKKSKKKKNMRRVNINASRKR